MVFRASLDAAGDFKLDKEFFFMTVDFLMNEVVDFCDLTAR